ncbi:MAG: metallophosphoesterase [Janthinobacterium lividum]
MPGTNALPHPSANRPRRSLRGFLFVILILAALHGYIAWRLLPSLLPVPLSITWYGWPVLLLAVLALLLSTLLIPLSLASGSLRVSHRQGDRIAWAGSLLMGWFSSLLVMTLLRDIVQGVLGVMAALPPVYASNSATVVVTLSLAVTLVGFFNARRLARVVDIDIPISNLAPALAGFTIIQLSDIHVGPTIKRRYVEAIVKRVNGLGADLVAITGDVVDGSVKQLAQHTAPLGKLDSRHGTYVVTGNHEYYSGASAWMTEFRRLGMQALMNEHVVLQHDGAELVVGGITDYSAHHFDLAQRSDARKAIAGAPGQTTSVLLAHQPRSAKGAADAGFDLQLSGHTHGGQFWPWNLFVRLQQPYTAGLARLGKLWVYTSRGTGYWGPPKRFGAPSEITRLRLVAAA